MSVSKFGSYMEIPRNTHALLTQLTSRPLCDVLGQTPEESCEEIKILEANGKTIFFQAQKVLAAYETAQNQGTSGALLSVEAPKRKYNVLGLPFGLLGGAVAYFLSGGVYKIALVAAVVIGGLTAFIGQPSRSTPTKDLSNLNLQVKIIKDWMRGRIESLEEQLKAADTTMKSFSLADYGQESNKKIVAKRDQLLAARAYFQEVVNHNYF